MARRQGVRVNGFNEFPCVLSIENRTLPLSQWPIDKHIWRNANEIGANKDVRTLCCDRASFVVNPRRANILSRNANDANSRLPEHLLKLSKPFSPLRDVLARHPGPDLWKNSGQPRAKNGRHAFALGFRPNDQEVHGHSPKYVGTYAWLVPYAHRDYREFVASQATWSRRSAQRDWSWRPPAGRLGLVLRGGEVVEERDRAEEVGDDDGAAEQQGRVESRQCRQTGWLLLHVAEGSGVPNHAADLIQASRRQGEHHERLVGHGERSLDAV